MKRFWMVATLCAVAVPAAGQTDKEVGCQYQADVVAAVQKARLDKVKERDVQKLILDSDPAWPDNYDNTIPLIAPWVYELPMKQVRDNDLGSFWNEACLKQP